MKSYAVAGLLLVGLATPALAASQHYAVKDTVGNCSVIDARPSANLRLDSVPTLGIAVPTLILMRQHVGNDGLDDVAIGIGDHDILAPNKIEEIGVGDLRQKVEWRREERDARRQNCTDTDIDAIRWHRGDRRPVPGEERTDCS